MDVLITGAARGIGAETARLLARRGHRVALVGLEPSELERIAADCPGSVAFEADVTDEDSMAAAVDGTVEAFGGIDAVLANAGISLAGFVRHLPPGEGERIVEVNLIGALRTARLTVGHLIERRGYILFTASLTALAPMPALAPYTASKAGVEAFAYALREEVVHHGVDVGIAYYLWIDSEMVRGADRIDVWSNLRASIRAPMNRTYPVAQAARDTADGIEARARQVMTPRWLMGLRAARSAIPALAARELRTLIPQAEREADAAISARGREAVVRPMGAGGAADAEARR